jgi:L-seryl-tRNA(Ser) seleniumtransferase
LRAGRPAVLGRLEQGRCLLDLRALPPDTDDAVRAAVLAASSPRPAAPAEHEQAGPCTS